MGSLFEKIVQKLNKGQDFLIMAVGDSITYGLNHCTNEETYCASLARMLAYNFRNSTVERFDGQADGGNIPIHHFDGPIEVQKGKNGKIILVRCGVGGDTVRRALNRSDDFTGTFITGKKPDLFLLMFGINDALSCDPSKFILPDKYYEDLRELLSLLKTANPEADIVFMTPTFNDNGTAEESCLDPYCEQMKRLANEEGCALIDTHSLWMGHLVVGTENYGQGDWLSNVKGDCCHFSPVGSFETAKYIFTELGAL